MASPVTQIILTFKAERKTKRTTLFIEQAGPKGMVGRLYVKNSALKTIGNPSKLEVTIVPK